MSKPLEEVDPDENPAAAAFQSIKLEEETPEGERIFICVLMSCVACHLCMSVQLLICAYVYLSKCVLPL